MKWNSKLYDSKHDFVSEYGKGLLEFIPNDKNQKILDLGCGTGTLTNEIASYCQYVLGVDGSKEMIEQAKITYPELEFEVGNALKMSYESQWDIVFSNAVFHWIFDHNLLLANIKSSLRGSGQLICEFGGHGNIGTIETGFKNVLNSMGYDYISKFNFSTTEKFEALLEKNGFTIDELFIYERPTILKDGEKGLSNWAKQFFASDLANFNKAEQEKILLELEKQVKNMLWDGSNWVADYKRLRAIAHI
ncbi:MULTISPECIES: class I SAM-dependent methyltransferase [unclassified Enterococcus]|uniref:class I SAM-dependent methyltransferase n=1 Tax=unclassified Enterococcus TaxID=2608891 RepID=UPI001552E220|nr:MULTISPECIES: class I SAM-dependent methyltransferase [unclassified Enterococcus]MBS7576272.1 methyltransferase domain-containing protein [Enterococcus sp. MMGLQ5-2]MBS7583505.1 methyltransferase domain-containing protein [Enterococcus sp. MMGLQ5-1]NPD11367.1 methyltransferase domain-containing protein [Enterococcus sp. MMGLQ5-1]NPD36110.1 methyltransferase domain-containing protein [Enterococcus sp. MMGLQ5-2]